MSSTILFPIIFRQIECNFGSLTVNRYTLKRDGKNSVKIQMSFLRVDSDIEEQTNSLIEQAVVAAQMEATKNGEKFILDLDSMTDKERIVFFSRILEGRLKMNQGSGGRWTWAYWSSKSAFLSGEKAIGEIPLLAISTVLPDNNDRHQFYVKYYDNKGPRDVFFRRVDRDRNLWSDGLYEFIEKVRRDE
eukprot:GHVP01053168.1.p1 GENE.GHVP01053168.1~~GHVP01053168.1.p1  ORF type:complete len:189 (+),score=23.77 GHVP01053168.1:477-1043(+)